MKFTIEREVLVKAIGLLQGVTRRSNTIPVLSCAMIRSDGDDRIVVTGTNLDTTVEEIIGASIVEPGSFVTPASTLNEIVRRLPEGSEISFETAEGSNDVKIRSGRSRFTVNGLAVDDFPQARDSGFTHTFEILAADFKRMIDLTRFAMATDETRYYLNGIFVEAVVEGGADVLRFVSTDGHRLSVADMPQPEGTAGMPSIIIPREAIIEIRKMIDDVVGPVTVSVSDVRFQVRTETRTLTSKLIDGTYPDYRRVIPTANTIMASIDRKLLSEAVARVAAVTSEKSRAVKMEITADNSRLVTMNHEGGGATEEIDVKLEGDDITVGFNVRYLLEMIDQVNDDVVTFAFASDAAPALIRSPKDSKSVFVLMPMRV